MSCEAVCKRAWLFEWSSISFNCSKLKPRNCGGDDTPPPPAAAAAVVAATPFGLGVGLGDLDPADDDADDGDRLGDRGDLGDSFDLAVCSGPSLLLLCASAPSMLSCAAAAAAIWAESNMRYLPDAACTIHTCEIRTRNTGMHGGKEEHARNNQ